MQAQRISAWMGIALAVVGVPLKARRILYQADPLPWMAYDYICLALLVAGAIMVFRGRSGRLLSAGWGFGFAMFYNGFFGYYERLIAGGGDHRFVTTMVTYDAAFLLFNVLGLVLSLVEPRRATETVPDEAARA